MKNTEEDYTSYSQIVEAVIEGNKSVGDLLEHPGFQRWFRTRCRRITNCEADAEELYQEGSLKLWEHKDQFGPHNISSEQHFLNWLCVVILHKKADKWRKEKKFCLDDTPSDELQIKSSLTDLYNECLLSEFKEFIKNLRDERQYAIMLWLEEHSSRDIQRLLLIEWGIYRSHVTICNWCTKAAEDFLGIRATTMAKPVLEPEEKVS